MLTEANIRKALKETIKSDKVDSWGTDFDFRKGGALDSLDHVTFVLHLIEDYGLRVRDDEFAQPLDTGDPFDLLLAPGDAVGLCIHYFHQTGSVQFPAGCMDPANEQREYGEIKLAY